MKLSLSRRILYAGNLSPGNTSLYRFHALERLGQDVQPFDLEPYDHTNRLLAKLHYHFPVGPLVSAINSALVARVREVKPEIVWMDKPTSITPATMRAIQAAGALTICYNQDNPFGPRHDGTWLQFKRIYRMFDLHCLLREADIPRYAAWGLPCIKVLLSFDPAMHFPPPPGWNDADRPHAISYTGSPYEERPAFLRALAERFSLPLAIAGPRWEKVFSPDLMQRYVVGGMLKDAAYRENIWRSRVNLSFITLLNEEDVAHKAFEITACGGFLLALRSPGHLACFEEGREAAFFDTLEECAEKARYYLDHPDEREIIAAAGRARAVDSGYDNDTQLGNILRRLDAISAERG